MIVKGSGVSESAASIRVRGARAHNLRAIDIDLPIGKTIAFTGVSGSGKTSLAFDTIFAEGRRRFLEGLVPQKRRFIDELPRPDVDSIEGLPPTISVGRNDRPSAAGPRATVATITELHDGLRLLYARLGEVHCPRCGGALAARSPDAIADAVMALPEGSRLHLLAPLIRNQRGEHREAFLKIRREGFVRARVDGTLTLVDGPLPIDPDRPHTIEMVVDRQILRPGIRERLLESIQVALRHGRGGMIVAADEEGDWVDRFFSSRFFCLDCDMSYPELSPRDFNFNSPHGACPTCQGLGSLAPVERDDADREETIEDREPAPEPCPDCGGARLNPVARSVTVAGKSLPALTRLAIDDASAFIENLTYPDSLAPIATPILRELTDRFRFLRRVGVGYIELDRPPTTLSGGEWRRIRLAGGVGAGFRGACYVLDEPTVGLHPRDTGRLLDLIDELRSQGNTVLVVEHDADAIRRSDLIVDLGPGAGAEGGRVVHVAPPASFPYGPGLTADYLAGRRTIQAAPADRAPSGAGELVIHGAREHNLKKVTVGFPLGQLIGVSGVSGSGKSSLVMDVVAPATKAAIGKHAIIAGQHDRLTGFESLSDVVVVDQQPIGRSARSMPVSFAGLLDPIRSVFARTKEARARGFGAARFSPTNAAGRCPRCQGLGATRVDLVFLPDLYVPCPVCEGKRFNSATLAIGFRGKSIADVLAMTIEQASEFFRDHPKLAPTLATLHEVGLSYMTLGQDATTLSGGEAQRLKLAVALAQSQLGQTLYVLDEPTSGLHFHDVAKLLGLLRRLVSEGATVIVIEHHVDMLAAADWLIDLGPEGGANGGQVIATGPPATIAQTPGSATGAALKSRYFVS